MIAGISLQTTLAVLKTCSDQDQCVKKFSDITQKEIAESLSIVLQGSFYVWIVNKIKHMDPVANYWIAKINQSYRRLDQQVNKINKS